MIDAPEDTDLELLSCNLFLASPKAMTLTKLDYNDKVTREEQLLWRYKRQLESSGLFTDGIVTGKIQLKYEALLQYCFMTFGIELRGKEDMLQHAWACTGCTVNNYFTLQCHVCTAERYSFCFCCVCVPQSLHTLTDQTGCEYTKRANGLTRTSTLPVTACAAALERAGDFGRRSDSP